MTRLPKVATKRLILASTSPYRRELLARITRHFEAVPPNVAEESLPEEQPRTRAARLACEKALAVAKQFPDAIVIGSDQVAALGSKVLRKPGTQEKAMQQLLDCSGATVDFYTSVRVLHERGQFDECYTDVTKVHFRELTHLEIENYVIADNPVDCAGSFRAEGLGVALFTAIDTHDPTAIVGLPLIWLAGSMMRAGISVLNV